MKIAAWSCLASSGVLAITLTACGGGGGNSGGGNNNSPTITSVTVSCSPSSIATSQVSNCTATVTGTGGYSSGVSWSVSPSGIGSVSSSGTFTAAASGTATITATSAEDSSKFGSATVNVSGPAPTFTGISPTSGPAGGGTLVTISGTNFRSGATVIIGGVAATSVSVVSSSSITALTPSHAVGSADVVITNADSTSVTGSVAFTFTNNPLPAVSSATPNPIAAGSSATSITVSGTSFTEQSTVSVDGTQLSSSFVSSSELTATVPAASLSYANLARLTVANPSPGGGASDSGPAIATGPTMLTSRYGQTATLLADGRVLICGGASGNTVTNAAEVYTPSTGQFTAVGSMTAPRYRHTATLLGNGKVLVAGGYSTVGAITLQSAELFDPSTNAFRATPNMVAPRAKHTATLLQSGKVLLTGGGNGGTIVGSEFYDPSTNSFSTGPQMAVDLVGHSAVALNDGTVLVLGGYDNTSSTYQASAELYNPASNSFSTVGSMQFPRSRFATVLLSSGKVLVLGGVNTVGVVADAEVYNPTTQTFSVAGQMNRPVFTETASLLSNGQVLVAGGQDTVSSYAIMELYDPATSTFSVIPDLSTPRFFATATPLSSGSILIAGGTSDSTTGLASTELFSLSNLKASYFLNISNPAPAISTISPVSTIPGNTVTLTGSGFLAGSELVMNGLLIPYILVSPTEITYAAPAAYGQYSVNVINPAPGGGSSNTVQQTVHVNISTVPSNPEWLPSSAHRITVTVSGGGDFSINVREGSSCGSFGGACTPTNSESSFCGDNDYIAPASPATCHIDFASSIDPSATATVTATISPNAIHATSITLKSERDQGFTATLLGNGNVLITGGEDFSAHNQTSSAELFNVSTHSSTALSDMTISRGEHTATLLQNGKVLITGGYSASGTTSIATSSAEIFDPVANTFTPIGSMSQARVSHLAALLSSGNVLIAGGCLTGGNASLSTEIFNVSSGTFASGPQMSAPHCMGQITVLQSGKILISGGYDPVSGTISGAELFDPTSNTFVSIGAMVQPRYNHTATLLSSGEVLFAGGFAAQGPTAGTEYYNPSSNSFSSGPALAAYRYGQQAALLPSGLVAIIGGDGPSSTGFDSPVNDIDAVSTTQLTLGIGTVNGRVDAQSLVLGDSSVLIVGGGFGGYTADVITFGAAVPSNPAPSLTGQLYSDVAFLSGYDISPGAVIYLDGQPQQTSVRSSEELEFSTPSGTHQVQVKNPNGSVSNILTVSF